MRYTTLQPVIYQETFVKILKKQEGCELLSIKPSCLEDMVTTRKFPPPLRIRQADYWGEESITGSRHLS
jgi:predicted DNA-binding transcriptional regulator AlpA